MARTERGWKKALQKIPALKQRFWENGRVPGSGTDFNQSLSGPAASPTLSNWPS